ncbi:dihydrofolate reductase family protein, partial [Nocardioides hankookensis]
MRVLVGPDTDDLAELYAPLRSPWLRVNMVSTVDGAATGASGTSGSINNAVDKQVFDHLRATCDVIVVGAATARAEGYGPADRPIVVVSRQEEVPDGLRDAP